MFLSLSLSLCLCLLLFLINIFLLPGLLTSEILWKLPMEIRKIRVVY